MNIYIPILLINDRIVFTSIYIILNSNLLIIYKDNIRNE